MVMTQYQADLYNYCIATGCIALIAVYVPLHAILPSPGLCAAYRVCAIFFALLSAASCFAGAALGGKLWQTLPTGVLLLLLAATIAIRVAGGWHSVAHRIGETKRLMAAVIEDKHWSEDVSRAEWSHMAERTGLGVRGLLLGGESDQDTVAVGLLRNRLWGEPGAYERGPEAVSSQDRNEPKGLAFLGLVAHRAKWMGPLLEGLKFTSEKRMIYTWLHHAGVLVWLAGLVCGAIAKTGWWPGLAEVKVVGQKADSLGGDELRVFGIWMQAILLLTTVFALPYTRGVARIGVDVRGRMVVLWGQALASLALGVASITWARELKVVETSVAYARTLVLSGFVATAWSIISVNAYGTGVKKLLRVAGEMEKTTPEITEEGFGPLAGTPGRRLAYLACLLTRPRPGHNGEFPVVRWGDEGMTRRKGRVLEVVLEVEEDGNGNVISD